MKLRTRLPRASTNASVAAAATLEEAQGECAAASDAGIGSQQCMQVLQQLEAFDTENVFTGQLTADGRLTADGPQVLHNLR